MKVKGHSNFDVSLVYESGEFLVRKSSNNPENNERLQNQLIKQQEHHTPIKTITTPLVRNYGYKDGLFYFYMDYYNCLSFSELFEKKNYTYIERCFTNIVDYVDNNILYAINMNVTSQIHDKYSSMRSKLKSKLKIELDSLDKYVYSSRDVVIPIGKNHGDLTMSNVLFDDNNNKIIFIDFLDSFIESPLNDITKLRQDTYYRWSLNLVEEKRDVTKLNIIFDKLDSLVVARFSKYSFYVKYYDLYQLINILRVLQYATNDGTVNFLNNCINNLLNNSKYE